MTEFFYRAESGRGRPWKEPAVHRIHELEVEMQRDRDRRLNRATQVLQLSYVCRETGHPLWVQYPANWTMDQAMTEAKRVDVTHNHRAWETLEL